MEYDDIDAELKETDEMHDLDKEDKNDGTEESMMLNNFLEDK